MTAIDPTRGSQLDRPGQGFQNLVATLERVLSSRPGVEIQSPQFLRDKDTGKRREHDVVITWRDAHHIRLTAIECKDTSRKVGVPQVEAFSKKCEKTGIHHGVIVSSTGFTRTANAKATALGIDLMMLRDVERFDWMAMNFIVGFHRKFDPVDIFVECIEEVPEGQFRIMDSEGTELALDQLPSLLNGQTLKEPNEMEPLVGKRRAVSLKVLTPGFHAIDAAGKRFSVAAINLRGSYTVERFEHEVRSHNYCGSNADYSIATTDLNLGGRDGKLVLVNDDEGIRVLWQPL